MKSDFPPFFTSKLFIYGRNQPGTFKSRANISKSIFTTPSETKNIDPLHFCDNKSLINNTSIEHCIVLIIFNTKLSAKTFFVTQTLFTFLKHHFLFLSSQKHDTSHTSHHFRRRFYFSVEMFLHEQKLGYIINSSTFTELGYVLAMSARAM